jgi:hypothetical protein
MSDLPGILSSLVGVQVPSVLFSLILIPYVLAGATCAGVGLVGLLSPMRRGRHTRLGKVYYWSLCLVFVTAVGLSALRWPEDAYLLALATAAFGVASLGYAARRIRWRGWLGTHLVSMSLSYVTLLTAFYVDNGPHLPLYNRLPTIVLWIGPSLVGLPLILRALVRHSVLRLSVLARLPSTRFDPRSGPIGSGSRGRGPFNCSSAKLTRWGKVTPGPG